MDNYTVIFDESEVDVLRRVMEEGPYRLVSPIMAALAEGGPEYEVDMPQRDWSLIAGALHEGPHLMNALETAGYDLTEKFPNIIEKINAAIEAKEQGAK